MGSARHGSPLRRLATAVYLATLLLGAIASAAVLPGATPAAAAHYRSSQLTWVKTGATSVRFTSIVAHDRSWHGEPLKKLGDKVGIIVNTGTTSQFIDHTVTYVDEANDWILVEASFTFTYPGVGPYLAYLDECCRLGSNEGHINNPNANNRLETIVNLAATSASPVSSITPIIDCARDSVCTFTVPATDADGQEMRFRFATNEEANYPGGGSYPFVQPGPPHAPNGARINATTGVYSWNTTGATLSNLVVDTYYSTQVVIENVSRGTVVSKTAVDFFIRLYDSTTNKPPVFDCPTPADGTVIDAAVGQALTIGLAAADPDKGDTVRLGLLGKPTGASFTATPGNPARATFTWTPTEIGATILLLTAQDQTGRGATQRAVTIKVAAGTPAAATHTVTLSTEVDGNVTAGPTQYQLPAGQCAEIEAPAASTEVFTGWMVDGQPAGHANPLTVVIDRDRTVVAQYATPPNFCDVQSGDLYYEAIRQLAARKIIRGFENTSGQLCFAPGENTRRAQLAALIARPLGWDLDERGNTFTDRCLNGNPNNCIDDALWRNVGTLQAEGVVGGYKRETCVALGLTPPCYGPHDEVLHAQVISFITRGMVEKGYWQYQPDNAALYPNVPADSGHRVDIATWVYYVGGPLPGTGGTGQPWAVYGQPSNRAWFAEALWLAFDSYFGLDRVP